VTNSVYVVIPTYNAQETVVESIKGIKSFVPAATVIIVDDNSPDGTATKAILEFQKNKTIKVLVRQYKQGRGSAVVAGFKEGLKDKHSQYFIEMDADLCHDPKYIPKLVEKCHKADIVIASKYLRGSTIKGLSLKRKIISRFMNIGAKIILRVPISDYSNGYRCYSRRAVEFICKRKLKSRGFVVLSEIAFACYQKGFSFAEIPFDFRQVSTNSKSNFSFNEMKEAFVTLLRLRFRK